MTMIPTATAPSMSRNKAKISNEFVSASDKKDHRVEFSIIIKKKMINGKEIITGCINKWNNIAEPDAMVDEITNKTIFANHVKDNIIEAFDNL